MHVMPIREIANSRKKYCRLFSAILPQSGAAVDCGRLESPVLDCAGWHSPEALEIPANVSLPLLPPCGPERNSDETALRFLKARYFAIRFFATAGAVKEKAGAVRPRFTESSDRIRSLGD